MTKRCHFRPGQGGNRTRPRFRRFSVSVFYFQVTGFFLFRPFFYSLIIADPKGVVNLIRKNCGLFRNSGGHLEVGTVQGTTCQAQPVTPVFGVAVRADVERFWANGICGDQDRRDNFIVGLVCRLAEVEAFAAREGKGLITIFPYAIQRDAVAGKCRFILAPCVAEQNVGCMENGHNGIPQIAALLLGDRTNGRVVMCVADDIPSLSFSIPQLY